MATVLGPMIAVVALIAALGGLVWLWRNQRSVWSSVGAQVESLREPPTRSGNPAVQDASSLSVQPQLAKPSTAPRFPKTAPDLAASLNILSAPFDATELEQLAIPQNRSMRVFLESSQTWPEVAGLPVETHWTWMDDRNTLLYNEQCAAAHFDPTIAPMAQSVTAFADVELMQRMELHFGHLPEWISRSWFDHEPRFVQAARSLDARLLEALRRHGVLYKDGVIGPHREEILRRSVPLLRQLAEKIVLEWKPFSNGPMYDQEVEAITSFVQRAIPYRSVSPLPDGKERGGLRLPGTTLMVGGDCDSKSLLLATLLRAKNPTVPIILVDVYDDSGEPHTLIGIELPPLECSQTLPWQGRTYVYIESTSGFGIGSMPKPIARSQVYAVENVPFFH
jgi:hypothetical protein